MLKKPWKRRLLVLWITLLVSCFGVPLIASAHPLGNFTINRYSRLEIGAAGIKIYYVLDMAEIPTFQEKNQIDLNQDGQISDEERLAYLKRKALELQSSLELSVNGTSVKLNLVQQDLSFPPGQGGLQLMRLTARFDTEPLKPVVKSGTANALFYQDKNYNDRLGWREIVVRNATGVAIEQSSAPSQDQSNELRTYPQDMLSSPLAVSTAQISIKLDPQVVVNEQATSSNSGGAITPKTSDPFADFINTDNLTLPVLFLSLLGAFVLGAFHALSPGHGKTVVAAYLVGSRGTVRHAAFLGLTVTVTHTLGVFALGLITLFASQFIVPDRLYPWLGLISGLIVILMGISLFRSRLRVATAHAVPQITQTHHHNNKEESFEHSHSHTDHAHMNGNYHNHVHVDVKSEANQRARKTEAKYNNSHETVQVQPPNQEHSLEHRHDHTHEHSTADTGHTHSHNGVVHSHLPPGTDGTAVTWRKLLLFGASAGLLPCPSALVVMLSAIALNKVVFGLVLIIIFSCGLAAAITGMGIALVYARQFLIRSKINLSSRLLTVLPVVSALAVTLIGFVLSYEALIQTGLFNR